MFTGLVERTGSISKLERTSKGRRLTISVSGSYDLHVGDSVAVNGCCLTVVRLKKPPSGERISSFQVDLLEETWKRTGFRQLKSGDLVNLERSLRAGDRLGGHFVTGHVDGTGLVRTWEAAGNDWLLKVEAPAELRRYLVEKGSITVDGISLTVAKVGAKDFTVWLIPHTRAMTNASTWQEGGVVNLEVDILGKYVERFVAAQVGGN